MALGLDWFRVANARAEQGDEYEAEKSGARDKLLAAARETQPTVESSPRTETLKLDSGKSLDFELGASDKVNKLTIDATRTFTRQGNSDVWDVNDNGTLSQWYGNIEFNKDGSYSYQVRGDKTKLTTKKNGNIVTTREDGSAVETRNDLTVGITYPNAKSSAFERDKGKLISVTESDGSVWKRNGISDSFICDKTKEHRTAVEVTKDGVYSYTDKDSARHCVSRTGRETTTYLDGSSVEKSADGLIDKIKRTSGVTVDCKYDAEKKLLSVTIAGQTTYSRTDGKSAAWTYSSGGKAEAWNGSIQVRPDGTCIYTQPETNGNEFVQRDGKRWIEGFDKSRVDITSEGYPSLITRPDGSRVECEYKDGKLSKVTDHWKSGGKPTWEKKSGEERWFCMDYPGSQRINLDVSKAGVITFDTVVGTKYTINTDNSQLRVKEDGTTIRLNASQQPTSVRYATGMELSCKWSGNSMTRLEEKSGGTNTIWEKDVTTGVWTSSTKPGESRRQMSLEDEGSFSYVALKDDNVTSIRYFDGTRRDFHRTDNSLSKVVETTRNSTTTWERTAGTDKWSNGTFTEERQAVGVSNKGEYSFRRKDDKQIYKFDATEDLERIKKSAPEKVEEAGIKLWNLIQKHVPDSKERNNFRVDMEAFYKRADVNGVSDDQVAKAFDALSALIGSDDAKSFLKNDQRVELSKQLLRHVAYPRAIDQGFHSTCNVTTVQVVMAAKQPEKFIDVVKQVALSGEYRTPGGTTVRPDANSLKPDWQAKLYKPYDPARNNSGRSFASQIFQVTAVNTYYASQGLNRRYEQRRPENPEDTGERLIDTTNNSVVAKVPDLSCANMVEANRQMTGSTIPILETNELSDANVTQVASTADLKTQLEDLQKRGKLPAIIMVNSAREPYFTETGKGRSGRPPGWHVVTVWNINQQGQVLVDNQWGRRGDKEGLRRMDIATLWQATRT